MFAISMSSSCNRASVIFILVLLSGDVYHFTVFGYFPDVERTHCGRCGSPLTYDGRGEFSVLACALDDPVSLQPLPSCHVMIAEKLPWIEIADELPRYAHGTRNTTPISYGPATRLNSA